MNGSNVAESFVKYRARKHGLVRSSSCEIPCMSLCRVATLNKDRMKSRSSVVETLSKRGIDLFCIKEVCWGGASARFIADKHDPYKFFGLVIMQEQVALVHSLLKVGRKGV